MSESLASAVIFDLDATLVDSQGVANAAFNAAYVSCGLGEAAPVDRFVAMSGVPLLDVCLALELPDAFPGAYRREARARQGDVHVFAGVDDLLRRLEALGLRMGIITGKDRPRTLETLDHLGLTQFFDAVVTPDDPPAPKPSPEGVIALCQALEADPESTLLVGDSTMDIIAGVAAGVTSIGCTWGVATQDELTCVGANCTHDTVAELTTCIVGRTRQRY